MYPKLYPAEHYHGTASLAGSWIDSAEPLRPCSLRTGFQPVTPKPLLLCSLESVRQLLTSLPPLLQEPNGRWRCELPAVRVGLAPRHSLLTFRLGESLAAVRDVRDDVLEALVVLIGRLAQAFHNEVG